MSSQWAATELPRWRRIVVDVLTEGVNQPAPGLANYDGWPAAAAAASLYWVTRDMTMIAYDAAESLPPVSPAAIMPSPTGMLIWNASLPPMPTPGITDKDHLDLSAVGVMWRQRGGRVDLWGLARTDHALEAMTRAGHDVPKAVPGPVLPIVPWSIPADELNPADADDITLLVLTTWELMMQPTIATPRRVTGAGGKGPLYDRADRAVTIVDLRPMQSVREDRDPDQPGRIHTHRWVVSAHPRMQRYGPGLSQVRRIWIPPYIKGPEGAPLVVRDRVNVWRR